ncbi:MAG: DUF2231 domain-containing protein [bacterium]
MLTNLAGLPAHALLVHAAVVLVPLAAIALAATGWKAAWRKAYSFPIAIMAVAGGIFAFLAKQTGEPLQHSLRVAGQAVGQEVRFGEHPEQGDTAFFFAMVFGFVAVAFWAIDRYRERWNLPKWSPIAAYGVALIPAARALVTMIVAGHSGATLVWKDLGTFNVAK